MTAEQTTNTWTSRRISRYETNQTTPLTCGHRHVTGSTVWECGDQTVCDHCHRTTGNAA